MFQILAVCKHKVGPPVRILNHFSDAVIIRNLQAKIRSSILNQSVSF